MKINLLGKYSNLQFEIDDEDYELIKEYRWFGTKSKKCPYIYVISHPHILLHRLIMKNHGYDIQNKEIDHINHDTLNNKKDNLRVTTKSENQRNKFKRCGKSKYKWIKVEKTGNFYIQFPVRESKQRKYYKLGTYINEEVAARVADLFAQYIDKEHYVINNVLPNMSYEETKQYRITHRVPALDANMETSFKFVLETGTISLRKTYYKNKSIDNK